MRVLLAPDGFGSALTPAAAAAALATGWRAGAPHDEVDECPLADGGPGFVATLHASLGGELLPVTVRDPWGEPTPATVLLADDGAAAYVEAAQAIGLSLVGDDRRDPTRTSSAGVGDLLAHARASGARRVVVGLGGSATNDAGMGMLAALGLAGSGALTRGGGALAEAATDDLAGLPALRADWAGVELVAACDVAVPLLGLGGASAGFSAQRGATPEQAQRLERALAHVARLAVAALGDAERPDLLSGRPATERLVNRPGAGAAGGTGFGLALLGARLARGSALVADAVRLTERLAACDLVVTGEGRFDWQSLHGTVVAEVAGRALDRGVPTVVVAGEVLVGRREQAAAGISAAYAVSSSPAEVVVALSDPAGTLAARARAVARTWSPPPR